MRAFSRFSYYLCLLHPQSGSRRTHHPAIPSHFSPPHCNLLHAFLLLPFPLTLIFTPPPPSEVLISIPLISVVLHDFLFEESFISCTVYLFILHIFSSLYLLLVFNFLPLLALLSLPPPSFFFFQYSVKHAVSGSLNPSLHPVGDHVAG